jgi:hypothetical protein
MQALISVKSLSTPIVGAVLLADGSRATMGDLAVS